MPRFKLSDKKIKFLKKVNKYSYWILINKSKIKLMKEESLSKRRQQKQQYINQINQIDTLLKEMFKDDLEFLELVKKVPSLKQLYEEQNKLKQELDNIKQGFELKQPSLPKEMNLTIKK